MFKFLKQIHFTTTPNQTDQTTITGSQHSNKGAIRKNRTKAPNGKIKFDSGL